MSHSIDYAGAVLLGRERALVRDAVSGLTLLVADWEADDDPRVNDVIARLAVELGAEPPR